MELKHIEEGVTCSVAELIIAYQKIYNKAKETNDRKDIKMAKKLAKMKVKIL